MNDNTSKLLEELATKLGTTAEYLWSVLIKQAPISATITIIGILLTMAFGFGLWKIHKKLSRKVDHGGYNSTLYEEYDAKAGFPMLLGAVIFSIMLIVCVFSFENVINGFFNPEFWAIKEIISSLK